MLVSSTEEYLLPRHSSVNDRTDSSSGWLLVVEHYAGKCPTTFVGWSCIVYTVN